MKPSGSIEMVNTGGSDGLSGNRSTRKRSLTGGEDLGAGSVELGVGAFTAGAGASGISSCAPSVTKASAEKKASNPQIENALRQ